MTEICSGFETEPTEQEPGQEFDLSSEAKSHLVQNLTTENKKKRLMQTWGRAVRSEKCGLHQAIMLYFLL